MSYSGLQSYGAYYGSSSNDQHGQGVYGAGQSSANTASIPAETDGYQASSRQPQYSSGEYHWSGQSQQNYGTVNSEAQSYVNSGWRGINSLQSRHSAPILDAGANQTFYGSTDKAVTQQSTRGVKNSAYASGLEAAGLHSQSGSSQQDLAASAAAALAGAVSRRHRNQPFPALAHPQQSTSMLSMGNAPSRDGHSTQTLHRATSPYGVSTTNTARVTQPPAQHNRALSSQYADSQTHRCADTSGPDLLKWETLNRTLAQNRVNNQVPAPPQNPSYDLNNAAQNNSSIANLVTNTSPQESLISNPQQQSTPSDAMPNFIDPSQIFDPYHEEYERKKREAAEAEAEARKKATEKAAEKPETWSQTVVPADSTAPPPTATSSNASEKSQKVGKRKEKNSGPVPPSTTSPQIDATSQTTSDADADMVSEMRAMIE